MSNKPLRETTRDTARGSLIAWLILAGMLCVATVAWIRPLVQRSKQIQTYALLQSMGHAVEKLPQAKRDRENIQKVISSEARGRDAWGNAVHVYVETRSERLVSYVLVSDGSDGRRDVKTSTEYFQMTSSDIRKQTARDIIFRDGHMITFAGK